MDTLPSYSELASRETRLVLVEDHSVENSLKNNDVLAVLENGYDSGQPSCCPNFAREIWVIKVNHKSSVNQ